MNYNEFQARDRRLVILRALSEAAQYRANAYLLRSYCGAVGHTVSTDALAGDLAWLAEQGLVTLEQPAPDVTVAVLSTRGRDVAEGTATHPGVARPQPQG